MNKNTLFATAIALLMVVAFLPFGVSEESDSLTPDQNISLSSKYFIAYSDASASDHTIRIVADLTGCSSTSTTVTWSLNDIGDGTTIVSLSSVSGTTVEIDVTGLSEGSVEIVATVDSYNVASAVVAVFTSPGTPTDVFHFYFAFQGITGDESFMDDFTGTDAQYASLSDGFWVEVTRQQTGMSQSDFNAMSALEYYATAQDWDFSASYAWINSMLGLGSYAGENGVWYYWAQYHVGSGDAGWEFNNYGLGYLTTQEYAYLGLIFWPSPSSGVVPDFPGLP